MLMLAAALQLSDAGIVAGLGYGVVFLGLILLMIVISIVGALFKASQKPVQEEPAPEPAPAPVAPGAAGQLKLHNVEPKTAAMLMAIVADKLDKPINELRFISIKEVE